MAKAEGIRGILFLQLCVTDDSVLKVQVWNGAYFLKSFPISSFVKVGGQQQLCVNCGRQRHGQAASKDKDGTVMVGPLSKTLHFLRSKLDFSMTASVLCPSREDCRLWQESFEALLAHKYGCLLFREFLQSEFSEDNLEFWLECEEFKRMKTETSAEQRQIDHQQQWHIMPIIQVAMELFGLNNNSSPSTGCCLPTDRPSSASASDHAQQLQFGGEKQRREQQQMTDNTLNMGRAKIIKDFVSYLARLRQFLADSAT